MSSLPLLMSRREWERLRMPPGAEAAAEQARRSEYLRYMDQASADMTSDWSNSLENMNRRAEEARLARVRAAELANEQFYTGYMERQRAEQARLMERARDQIFQDKDAPKMLLSAVIECATLKERELQHQFQKQLQAEEDELKRQHDANIIERARLWHEEKKKKEHARFLVNKEQQKDISKQIVECSERIRLHKEEQVRLEMEDNEKGKQQIAFIKDFEEKFRLAERERIRADIAQANAEVGRRRREEGERDRLDERLRDVYLAYKHNVDCRRARTEKELQEEKLRVLENISKKLQTGTAARDAAEQAILDEAVREKEQRDEARALADRRKAEAIRNERLEARRKFLADEARRRHEEGTLKTWSMLNRIKNTELTKEFELKQREVDWKRTLEHREDLIKLWKEREEREAAELAEKRYFYGELAEWRLHEADAKVLRHAALLREEARAAGRPTVPIDYAVRDYRRMYGLFPSKHLPRSQQEHFSGYAPTDRTLPPPPPPPAQRNDGLQERLTARLPREGWSVADDGFKRQGKSNGLQVKLTKDEEGRLPKIVVIPFKPKTSG